MSSVEAQNSYENSKDNPTASYGGAVIGPGEQIGQYKLLRILGEGGYLVQTKRESSICQASFEKMLRRCFGGK